MHFVYLLRCKDDTLYCGIAKDPRKRLAQHNAGKGAKYTRGRLPVSIVYLEKVRSLSKALKREWEIKGLTREEKVELVSCSDADKFQWIPAARAGKKKRGL